MNNYFACMKYIIDFGIFEFFPKEVILEICDFA